MSGVISSCDDAFIKANSTLPILTVVERQRSWTDPVQQALQAVRQTIRYVCVSERLSKKREL